MGHRLISTSSQHRLIREAAKTDGLDVNALRELFWHVNAHHELIALPRIAEILREICELIQTKWGESLAEFGMADWPPLLEWIINERTALGEKLGDLFDRRSEAEDDNPMLRRGIRRYPLYGALYNSAATPSDRERYRLLQAHLLVAHVRAVSDFSVLADYEAQTDAVLEWQPTPNSIYPATLALRHLSLAEQAPYLRLLPADIAPEDFAVALADIEISPFGDVVVARHRDLRYFLAKVWGELEWRERTGTSGGRSPGQGVERTALSGFTEINAEFVATENLLGDPEDPGSSWGQQTVISTRRANRKRQRELLNDDLDPDEFDDEQELVLTGYDGSDQVGVAGLTGPAQGQIRHIAMASQLLPWSPQQLVANEVTELLRVLDEIWTQLSSKGDLSKSERAKKEVVVFLQVVFWTSSPLDRTRKLRLLAPSEDRSAVDFGIVIDPEGTEPPIWVFKAIVPPYQLSIPPVSGMERMRQKHMELPDLSGIGARICTILADIEGRKPDSAPKLIFRKTEAAYRKLTDVLLKDVDPSGRLTTVKLGHVLFDRVACGTQKVTEAMAMFGRTHALGRVRLFYDTSYIKNLQAAYRDLVVELGGELSAAGWNAPTLPPLPEPSDGSVGSRACPSFEAVRDAIATVKAKLEQPLDLANPSERNHYHALYTLFAIWHQAFATARRAVVTPYISMSAIDPETGVGTLTEKDDGRGYRKRMVWLPPLQRSQGRMADRHMAVMARMLDGSIDEPVFLVGNDARPRPIRPRDLEALMKPFLPFQPNVQRRFMRMQLLDRGCCPEVVDAWMGHWCRGEEPWADMSSLSFADCIRELHRHLIPILDELGLTPLESQLS